MIIKAYNDVVEFNQNNISSTNQAQVVIGYKREKCKIKPKQKILHHSNAGICIPGSSMNYYRRNNKH